MAMKEEIETRNVAEMARSENQQAGKNVAVTREMIEAGVGELLGFEPEGDDFRLTVRSIFEAMLEAAPQSLSRA